MTITRKAAGEARERPRPSPHPEAHSAGANVVRKNVGAAPIFDTASNRLTTTSEAHRGMISNPWVKHWSGRGPAPTAPTAPATISTPAEAQPQKRAAGGYQRSSGKNSAPRKRKNKGGE
jgi:hypothetical protein